MIPMQTEATAFLTGRVDAMMTSPSRRSARSIFGRRCVVDRVLVRQVREQELADRDLPAPDGILDLGVLDERLRAVHRDLELAVRQLFDALGKLADVPGVELEVG